MSKWAIAICLFVAVSIRLCYFTNNSTNGYNATTYDALGYYLYAPSILLHEDVNELNWFPKIDSTYQVSGGYFYQASPIDSGKFVFKYLGGVSILQLPFFATGHVVAHVTDAPEDGFSWPYQYAIMWGAIFWLFIGLIFLRKILLCYYSETITTLTLLMLVFASNILQYVSVDGAMSHAYIFPLYSIVIWLTIQWHEKPSKLRAFAIGSVIGLATICRPTELILFFIPLLWSLENNGRLKSKWALVREHKSSIYLALLGGLVGLFPQLVYWKLATGSWIYDVGSKWVFFNPWWRVLIGFEKGWFIYTPIAIFFCWGLFLMKGKPFRKAVLTFCLINIWVIISWWDWRYGATYSCRALIQSYPVFALAFAAFLQHYFVGLKKGLILGLGTFLVGVNLFQIWQYNATILHFDHMNASYYRAIYLDRNPTPLDYSLLDTDEQFTADELISDGLKKSVYLKDTLSTASNPLVLMAEKTAGFKGISSSLNVNSEAGLLTGTFVVECFQSNQLVKSKRFRLAVPQCMEGFMRYENHVMFPPKTDSVVIKIETFSELKIKKLNLRALFVR